MNPPASLLTGDSPASTTTSVTYSPSISLSGFASFMGTLVTLSNNALSTGTAFFNELKGLGYSSASQVPASLIQFSPSTFVPTAMLNSSFNATEMQALYTAFLIQLKTWFNQTSGHQLKGNQTFTNSTFINGFVQLYGNLTVIRGAAKTYYNNTYVIPLIDLGSWNYKVHTWSNITNGTPDPNWLITSGSNAGTLLNLQDATFYTLGITVNGTATSSYTIKPVTIQYVLPQTIPIGTLSTGGFFASSQFGLAVWEWIVMVFIVAGVIGVVYGARRRRR
jgi:hypothetical protein